MIPYQGGDRYWLNAGNIIALYLVVLLSFLPMTFAGILGYNDTFFEYWVELDLMPPECI